MKKEPWIDQLFVKKFDEWSIPVSQNHWVQALELIEADERKKKRRFLWLFMGLALLAGGASLAFYILIQNENLPSRKEIKMNIPATPISVEPMAALPGLNLIDRINADQGLNILNNKNDENKQSTNKVEAKLNLKINTESKDANNLFNQLANNEKKQIINDQRIEIVIDRAIIDLNENKALIKQNSVASISFLQNDFNLLDETNRPLSTSITAISIKSTVYPKWTEMGVRASLAQNNNTAQRLGIESAGLEFYYQKSFHQKMFWGLGLGYTSIFNSSIYSQIMTTHQYKGFDATETNFGIKPKWLNYFHLSATAGVHIKRSRIYLGAKPELLLGVHGDLDNVRFTDINGTKALDITQVQSLQKGWLNQTTVQTLNIISQLGYDYFIRPDLGIGVQLNHYLRPIFNSLPGDLLQSKHNTWNMGFRVSYKLK